LGDSGFKMLFFSVTIHVGHEPGRI
jgi:hypothetical protein